MMSDKCKSPTAALTCPDTPKDHSVLPEVLKNDEYADTAVRSDSPEPEASAVPHPENGEQEAESPGNMDVTNKEKENADVTLSKAPGSAYSIVDILNATSANHIKGKDQDQEINEDKNTKWLTVQPPTEQQLKSNLPDAHPLKNAVKTNVVIETPRPADVDMYHSNNKSKGFGDIPSSHESSLLRKNLTEFGEKFSKEKSKELFEKTKDLLERPKDLLSPSKEQYDAWLKQLANKSDHEPEAKKQKVEGPLSPSVANSYLQGQAAASLWYQNMAAVSPVFPYSAPYTDPLAASQIQNLGMYPGYIVPKTKELEKKKPDSTKMQKDHDKLFQCRKCPRNFTSSVKLLRHELTHPYARPFNCGLSLRRKQEEVPKPKAVPVETSSTCLLCGEKYPNQMLLQAHVAQVHRKQSIAVSPVSAVPSPTTTETQYFRCSFCSQYLPSRLELIEHEKVHLVRAKTNELTMKCPKCYEIFNDPIAFKEHERKHHPQIPREAQLAQPMFPEPELRPTMLQECLLTPEMEQGETIPSNNNNSLESNGNLDHSCPICQKHFISAKLLKSHVKYSHLEERPFTCTVCSKSFKQKATLKQHEKLHSDEKPYVCNICSRGFVYPSRLKTHSQTCKGEPVISP